jgi:hypothetical protein
LGAVDCSDCGQNGHLMLVVPASGSASEMRNLGLSEVEMHGTALSGSRLHHALVRGSATMPRSL